MDEMAILEIRQGQIYYSNKQLAEMFGFSLGTINRRKAGIEKERKRYGKYAIAGSRTNLYVFVDYETYHEQLEDPIARKHVPPYDPMEVATACGHGKCIRMLK